MNSDTFSGKGLAVGAGLLGQRKEESGGIKK